MNVRNSLIGFAAFRAPGAQSALALVASALAIFVVANPGFANSSATDGPTAGPVTLKFVDESANSNSELQPYVEKIIRHVEKNWTAPPDSNQQVKLLLDLKENGELIKVGVYASSGDTQFDNLAIEAVRNTAPFPRFPQSHNVTLIATFGKSSGNQAQAVAESAADDHSKKRKKNKHSTDFATEHRTQTQENQHEGFADPQPPNSVPQNLTGSAERNAISTADNNGGEYVIKPRKGAPLQGFVGEMGAQVDTADDARRLSAGANVPMYQPFGAGTAQTDSRVPMIPKWKLDLGYDVVLGRFHVGFIAVDNPPIPVALLGNRIKNFWRGFCPEPCHIRMFKLPDNSGGYYFICLETRQGPTGWLMPMPKTQPGARQWAVYFAQRN